MGTQQHVRIEIESIVHGTRRVVARNVERFEVVVVVFDFRAFGDFVADAAEALLDALQRAGDRMQAAAQLATARQGDVDALRGQPGGQRGPFQLGLTRVQRILDLFLGHVDQRADLRPLFGRQVAQGLHHLGQFAFLAEVVNPDLLQGIDVFGVSHSLNA